MRTFPAATERYFATLGKFIAFWAATEFSLDNVCRRIIAQWDGDDCPEPRVPDGTSRKIALFRDFVKEHDLGGRRDKAFTDKMQADFDEIADELCTVAEARHWAAHGNGLISIVAKHDNDTLEFIRTHKRKPGAVDKRKYTIAKLEHLTDMAWYLAKMLFTFDHLILHGISKDHFYQMFPEHRGKLSRPLPRSKRLRHKTA